MIDLHKISPELFILDVGHGNCAILQDTEAVTVIDCGYNGSILIQTLERLGIDEVDHVLISHADIDHIGGLVSLVKELPVHNIYLNADSSKQGKKWRDILITLGVAEESGSDIHIGLTTRYSKKIISGEVNIEILAPSASVAAGGSGGIDQEGRVLDANATSAVIGLVHDAHRVVLLPGDIDEIGLDNLLKHHQNIESHILVFPHHGGNPGEANAENFAERLCNLVKPDTVVFSLDRIRYNNPNESIIRGVVTARRNAHIMCTQLSQKCSAHLLASEFGHLTNLPAKGYASDTCCGGTIRIKINGNKTNYVPLSILHRKFVNSLSNPLCLRYLNERQG